LETSNYIHAHPLEVPGNKVNGRYLCFMIHILSAEQLRQTDAHTIATEPIASIDLMERAALRCANRLMESLELDVPIVVLAGMGNNGGDGLAMARILKKAGQRDVRVVVPGYKAEGSPDFTTNLARLKEERVLADVLKEDEPLPTFDPKALVVDALFGTGLQKPLTGWLKDLVGQLNNRPNKVLSIDLPSGLFADSNQANDVTAIVQADRTFTLELPKRALLLPDDGRFAGDWEVVPIGLDRAYISSLTPWAVVMEGEDLAPLLPPRRKTAHKGDFGHAWLLAGGPGKMGAALLAARAALRSGCGLLTWHGPAAQRDVVHAGIPEAMVSGDPGSHLSEMPKFNKVSAIGMGPGIGTAAETGRLLKLLIQQAPAPFVLDADALNILSENKTWLAFLPAGTILTPHPIEFERLAGKAANGEDRLRMASELAVKQRVVVVLKGACTAICSPDGRIFFNTTGNPGMAKGGSGDVLTGIITSLRAQGLDALSAALLGVHAHGLAGDLAATELDMDGMLPSDLIGKLPAAWRQLRSLQK
jgi:NAD(P)H-hydrate epimerase